MAARRSIDRRWLPLNALRAFDAVGRHESFTAAAQALGVSQSAVSRHVIALEGLLGCPLVERKPGPFTPTEAGAALLPVLRRGLDRIEGALNEILHERGAGPRSLRVDLPPTFAQTLAVPILREFRATCPDIILDIETLREPGLSSRDPDAAVVYARPQVTERVASLLWMERVTPVCHPDVARRLPEDPVAALAAVELLHVKLEGEPRHALWTLMVRQACWNVDVERGLVFDTSALAAQYARTGEGIALLDDHMFAAELAAGTLVAPFPRTVEGGYGYYLTVAPEDLADPAIAKFRSWMIARFGVVPATATARPMRRSQSG